MNREHYGEIRDRLIEYRNWPEKYVLWCYPWGKRPLLNRSIRKWQWRFLRDWGEMIRARGFNGYDPVEPIRMSVVSGHGVGKTALAAWCINFLHDTRPESQGTVTAVTAKQLANRTWAEVGKWRRMGLTSTLSSYKFSQGNMTLMRPDNPKWAVHAFTARRESVESIQGQHADTSSSFFVFDEASGIHQDIFESAYGGMTDGEPHFICFGNGTQPDGEFRRQHARLKRLWKRYRISSMDVEGTNKEELQRWIDVYGWDSDFVRVRIRGEFPNEGEFQFIPTDWIDACRGAPIVPTLHDPLVFGVDVAREGADFSVIFPRRGRDATGYLHPIDRWHTPDTTHLADRIVNRARSEDPDAIFVDAGGVGGGVIDLVRRLGVDVEAINSAKKAPDPIHANFRTHMYANLKQAIYEGIALDPDDDDLYEELLSIRSGFRLTDNALILESKQELRRRGISSPDKADGLAFTYALPVPARGMATREYWDRLNREGPPPNYHSSFPPHRDMRTY